MKNWYTSKTLWTNIIAVIVLLVQTRTGFVIDPEIQTGLLAIINLILRAWTKTPLDWNTGGVPPAGQGDRPVSPTAALLLIGLLTVAGCAGTGSKGGVTPPLHESSVQIAGKSLLAAKSTIVTAATATDSLCKTGQMPADKCAQAKLAYKTSQHAYDAAVDAYLLLSTQGGDPAELTQALIRVHDIANHLLTLAGE